MIELPSFLKKLRRDNSSQLEDSTRQMRRRAEGLLFTDRISEEIRKMLITESGCGFQSLIQVMRHFDSPVFASRESQKKLVKDFKHTIGDLDAWMNAAEIVKFCAEFDLGVKIVAIYYNTAQFPLDLIQIKLLSNSIVVDFPFIAFQSTDQIVLGSNQSAMVGLENGNSSDGHYLAFNEADIFSRIAKGGEQQLEKYINDGYQLVEIIIFEKK